MSRVPIGVKRSSVPGIEAIEAYEQFLGMPFGITVDYVLAFMSDTPASWDQFEGAIVPSNSASATGTASATGWAPLLGPRQLMLGVPACCMGTTWAQEAAGVNDMHWAALARTLMIGGLGDCVLRIGRELNGSWYRWKVTPSNVAAYRTGYARIVSVMRDAGFTGAFMWNPYLGQGTFAPGHGTEDAYPGDGCVDVIGVDIYDGNWSGLYPGSAGAVTTAAQRQVWDQMLTEWDSLRGWYNLALNHGKQLAFPEWGLRLWEDAGVYHGGGDNAVLVAGMAEFIKGCGAFMHALWEDPGMGVSDPDDDPRRMVPVPQARSVFLREFGY